MLPHLRAFNTASDGFEDRVALTANFRLPPSITPEDVQAVAAELSADGASLRAYSAVPAYLGAKNTPLVRQMLAAIRAQDQRPGFVLKGGTSDMNVVGAAWSCPIVAYGPGDSSLDHTPQERIALDEYAQAVHTLRHLIEHLTLP